MAGRVAGGGDGSGSSWRAVRRCWYAASVAVTDFVMEELQRLEREGLLRVPDCAADLAALEERLLARGRRVIDACSNDYLGFGARDVSRETLSAPAPPAGARASRLIFGTTDDHDRLEQELATWLGYPTTLLFSSGYAANLGVLAALCGPGDLIVSDALNHASIVDGARLSRASIAVVPHRDLAAFDRALRAPARRRFVVTEAYFSMDGDAPDLPALASLVTRHDACWILDEAHSLGVFGPEGRGLAAAAGVMPHLLVGTLGKAFGLHGAFVAAAAPLRTLLWNRARSFVYSTATSPLLARLASNRLSAVRAAAPARRHLLALAQAAHRRCADAGLVAPTNIPGPILALPLGHPDRARAIAQALCDDGFLVRAIRPPTVPPGTARLRIVLHADHSASDVDELLDLTFRAAATLR